jgi:hypothetical protein
MDEMSNPTFLQYRQQSCTAEGLVVKGGLTTAGNIETMLGTIAGSQEKPNKHRYFRRSQGGDKSVSGKDR